jgi:hypothetical protein
LKLLKLSILLFGAVGLALVLEETDALAAGFEHAPLHTALILLGWAVPVAMGILTLVKPPLRSWHAAASLAGFAVVAIRTRIWEAIPDLADVPVEGIIAMVAMVGGVIVSALAVARPEGGS